MSQLTVSAPAVREHNVTSFVVSVVAEMIHRIGNKAAFAMAVPPVIAANYFGASLLFPILSAL